MLSEQIVASEYQVESLHKSCRNWTELCSQPRHVAYYPTKIPPFLLDTSGVFDAALGLALHPCTCLFPEKWRRTEAYSRLFHLVNFAKQGTLFKFPTKGPLQ